MITSIGPQTSSYPTTPLRTFELNSVAYSGLALLSLQKSKYICVWKFQTGSKFGGGLPVPTLRKLSGPQLLHLGKDFVSKPHIWNPAPWPSLFKTQPSSQITGAGRTATAPLQHHHTPVSPQHSLSLPASHISVLPLCT